MSEWTDGWVDGGWSDTRNGKKSEKVGDGVGEYINDFNKLDIPQNIGQPGRSER